MVGVFAYHGSMREGRRMAYRSLHGEYAEMLARSGLQLAQAHLARALRDPASELRRALLVPFENLVAGGSQRVELGAAVDLAGQFPDIVDRLVADLPRGRAGVERFEARFHLDPTDLVPLPALELGPKVMDRTHCEKGGRIHVTVRAEVAFAPMIAGVSRTVASFTEFRVVHPPLPLLSDFTLFLETTTGGPGGSGAADVNGLAASHKGFLTGASVVPLVLSNGVADMHMRMADLLDPDFLRGQGWIYLGRDPVVLNLTYSQEETVAPNQVGEDFHFYQQSPTDLAAGRALADPSADERANRHLSSPFWEIRNWDMGVHSLSEGPLEDEYARIFEDTPAEQRRGSLLKLFGRPPDQVSPAVVLGPVDAGFFRITAAVPRNPAGNTFDAYFTVLRDRSTTDGFKAAFYQELLPFVGRLLYLFDPTLSGKYVFYDTSILGALLGRDDGVSVEDYRTLSSRHRTRSYNRALLHLKGRNEDPDPTEHIDALGIPAGLFDASPVASPVASPGASLVGALARSALPGSLLPDRWRLALADLPLDAVSLEALATPLDGASCWTPPAGTDPIAFLERTGMLAGGVLDLGTSVTFDGPLVLPAISRVLRGGVILAKEITVQGALPAPDSGATVLVATGGPVRVSPGAGAVAASLVSLAGAFELPADLDLTGNVVARRLDLSALRAGGGTGAGARLAYDPVRLKTRSFQDPAPDGVVVDFSRRFVRVH